MSMAKKKKNKVIPKTTIGPARNRSRNAILKHHADKDPYNFSAEVEFKCSLIAPVMDKEDKEENLKKIIKHLNSCQWAFPKIELTNPITYSDTETEEDGLLNSFRELHLVATVRIYSTESDDELVLEEIKEKFKRETISMFPAVILPEIVEVRNLKYNEVVELENR